MALARGATLKLLLLQQLVLLGDLGRVSQVKKSALDAANMLQVGAGAAAAAAHSPRRPACRGCLARRALFCTRDYARRVPRTAGL